jgi:hypothetical protein
MKGMSICVVITSMIIMCTVNAMAIEEAKYNVVEKEGPFEIRDYAPHILAEVFIDATLEEAGNKAFSKLFRYISGSNRPRVKIEMTAPVSQEPRPEKIKMTAPVGQQPVEGGWAVSFMMPASYSMETLPEPDDPDIKLRQVPASRMAAVRYSGFWSESGYLRNKDALESWTKNRGLAIVGQPIWARYNPPFTPWFLRRNEVLIPIDAGTY